MVILVFGWAAQLATGELSGAAAADVKPRIKVRNDARPIADFSPAFAPKASGEHAVVKRITPCLLRGIGRNARRCTAYDDRCASKAGLPDYSP
jgi:hypothetical protein